MTKITMDTADCFKPEPWQSLLVPSPKSRSWPLAVGLLCLVNPESKELTPHRSAAGCHINLRPPELNSPTAKTRKVTSPKLTRADAKRSQKCTEIEEKPAETA